MLLRLALGSRRRSAAIDASALDTAITDGPAEGAVIEDERPTFSFTATLAGAPFPAATFRCSVDDAPAEPCASPFETAALEEGAHSFSVFAEDAADLIADPDPGPAHVLGPHAEEECEVFEDEEGLEEEDRRLPRKAKPATGAVPPEECLLRTARARLFTYSAQNRIRLVIRYTAFAPADVYRRLPAERRQGIAEAGHRAPALRQERPAPRQPSSLGEGEMDKVRAAKRFTVAMNVPAAPRYCHRYDTRHLTIRRTVHNQVVWFQSDSIFGS